MKVLVTGASGFLGSWVAQLLSERGDDVRVLVRKSSDRTFLKTLRNVELAEGGVEDAAAVKEATAGVEGVVHVAGLIKARNEDEFRRTNVDGTKNLIDGARAHSVKRFVHVSSLEACGPSRDGSPVPKHQKEPVTAYGRSKLAAEEAVLGAKDEVHAVILRPAAIYGPRDREIFAAFQSISRGLMPTIGSGDALGCFIYAEDCARACIAAMEASVPSGSIYNVDDDTGSYTQRRVLETMEEALGKKALVRFGLPVGLLKTVARGVELYGKATDKPVMLNREKARMLLMHWVCESKDTQRDLEWKPTVTWSEGAKKTARWYKDQGWL